jgi:phage-related holin
MDSLSNTERSGEGCVVLDHCASHSSAKMVGLDGRDVVSNAIDRRSNKRESVHSTSVGVRSSPTTDSNNMGGTKNRMKSLIGEIGGAIRDVVGSTPVELVIKIFTASFALLWLTVSNIAEFTYTLTLLIVIDAVLGLLVAKKEGKALYFKRFLVGPIIKICLFAMTLFALSIIDTVLSRNTVLHQAQLLYWSVVFLSLTMGWDVLNKLGKLTGIHLGNQLRERLTGLLPTKQKDEQ